MARVGLVGKPVPFRRKDHRSGATRPEKEELHDE